MELTNKKAEQCSSIQQSKLQHRIIDIGFDSNIYAVRYRRRHEQRERKYYNLRPY
nr:MAG TPA: hypothetical protein [Caudoviricetes sp.]